MVAISPMSMKPVTSPRPLPLLLLADADAGSQLMYAESLKLASWAVEEAVDGREALALALAHRPDVIVTDSHLPGMSGYDLCSVLRRDLATKLTPIILVTADGLVRDFERAKSAGATSVLVKPCLPQRLVEETARLMEHSRALRARSAQTRERIPRQFADSARLIERAQVTSRRMMSRLHLRGETERPPAAPPELVCPNCDRMLEYKHSQLGGVSAHNAEQWDYFSCGAGCGTFQYRQRTRKLRRISD
jgi:CheY-like chemotaxis protein